MTPEFLSNLALVVDRGEEITKQTENCKSILAKLDDKEIANKKLRGKISTEIRVHDGYRTVIVSISDVNWVRDMIQQRLKELESEFGQLSPQTVIEVPSTSKKKIAPVYEDEEDELIEEEEDELIEKEEDEEEEDEE